MRSHRRLCGKRVACLQCMQDAFMLFNGSNFTLIPSTECALLSDSTVSASARADGPGAPDKLNWDYSVDGSAEFKPEVMFYDGHSIWMRMPAKAQT
ncbi:TrbG/VirB9 family P-type conjugative transfer protein [Paraburkholderia sp. BL6665CI2N2]|uniref:TrbG/VirB9 family P-type conjugative transfer protein n=1 Tax=Paraburkholderia sp. BL6665CI2N2 TaxID=1938806 RepID=UPI001FBACCF2|nr:TrbG/VirB9 family P-type conjugative transfer protein [Paraburkholderia sp. BL6665CI2N2]